MGSRRWSIACEVLVELVVPEDDLPVVLDDLAAAVVHGDEARVGERVVALEGVGQRHLGVAEEDRARGRLGDAHGVDRLVQRLLEEVADHAGDGLDEGRLALRELLDGDPVHVDDRRVHRADDGLGLGALGLVAALVGGQHVLGSRDAAEGVGVLLLGRAAQEDRRVARVSHGVVHVVARVEQVRVGGGRVEREDHGAGGELRDDLRGDRLERDVRHGEDDDVGVLDGVGSSVTSRPASTVRCWPAGEFST